MAVDGGGDLRGDGVGALLDEYRKLRDRYGDVPEGAVVDRVLTSVAARRARLQAVRREIEQLRSEERWLIDEIRGRHQSLELLLADVVRRIGRVVDEAWSPFPVLAYRMWTTQPAGLRGAKVTWRSPQMTATCLKTARSEGVPHADGRCGRLGCGVYGTKALRPLLTAHLKSHSYGYAVGLVAMSGKVVEHEHGYRAEDARMVALVVVAADHYVETDDPQLLDELCNAPEEIAERIGIPKPAAPISRLEHYLEGARERRTPWISASNDG